MSLDMFPDDFGRCVFCKQRVKDVKDEYCEGCKSWMCTDCFQLAAPEGPHQPASHLDVDYFDVDWP